MKPKLASLVAALALLALPAESAAPRPSVPAANLPPEFVGISPQTGASAEDFALMELAGLRNVRLPLIWMDVQRHRPVAARPDWSHFDNGVRLAAEHGMRVFPFVWGSPEWIAAEPRTEPVDKRWAARAWASFLRQAVRRYGAGGHFWWRNPDLPYLPIEAWEIWNEQNIVSFGHADPERFARLLRVSGRVVHRADPGAKVILGGLFGRPLQVPPNAAPGDFLARVYRAGGVRRHLDGVGLHPYVAEAKAMRSQIRNLRRVMRRHGDAAAQIYLTELGWGSDSYQTRWERGLRGQARELHRAFSMLSRNRHRWRIGGIWWFSWADIDGGCQFCDSAGLLTKRREAKPAWYRFTRWTGGDAAIVPRAAVRRCPGRRTVRVIC